MSRPMDTPDQEKRLEGNMIDDVAMKGHYGTDAYGNALIHIDKAAEARLFKKMSWRILPIIALMYLFCFIDRANIGNARVAGLPQDLGMTGTYDFNLLLTAFYLPYALSEPFMNYLCKVLTPGKFLPASTVAFGLFSLATGFVHTFGAAIPVRVLLGIAEGGVFPGMAYYLSRWYTKAELPFIFSIYVIGAPLAGAFGGLLASALLLIPAPPGYYQWTNLFLVEGAITMVIGIASFFIMTDRPEVATWLTEEEKALCAARIKADNVGSAVVLDSVKGKVWWSGFLNPTTLICSLIFLLDNITVQGLGFFLPSIVRNIFPGLTTVEIQLRTVPPYIVGGITSVIFPYISYKMNKKGVVMLMNAPLMAIGFAMFVGSQNGPVRYAAAHIIASGAYAFGSLCNSWAASNVTSDTARNGAIACVVMCGNIGGTIATWTFLTEFNPEQLPGNSLNLASSIIIFCSAGGLWAWQTKQNKAKEAGAHDHILEGKSIEEVATLGTKHPGFRYRY